MYEKVLLWATPVFLLLMALECAVARLRRRSPYRLADALSSVGLGALSTYLGVFTRLVTVGIYVWVYREARVATLDAGSPWVWATGLLLYDFLYYWNHRLGHEVNVLWAAHVVHHQSEEFNLSTALRQTGSGFLLSWLFYVPLAVLGFPPPLYLALSLIDLLYQFWIHTEQIGTLGLFDRIFASPSNHRVHHGINDVYVDRNYGGILIIWDRLFGTFQPELAAQPVVYGTRDPLRSWNPLWANLHTYAALFADAWRAGSWPDKVAVFLRRPGWRPADAAARAPKLPFRLDAFAKFAPPLPPALGGYCLLQGFVIIGFGAHFMSVAPGWPTDAALGYLAALAASLWIISGLAEGRREFVPLELLRLAVLALTGLLLLPGGAGLAGGGGPLLVGACAALTLWVWRAARPLPRPASA